MNSGAKAETRAGLWVLDRLRDEIETTDRLYSTDTEGQAFEETMNKAVRYQGTAFLMFFTF